MMNSEEEKRCPLCAEEMDWTDQQFLPCKCGYQICVWCWHHIIDMAEKDNTDGRCPACRAVYEKDKIVAMQAKCERTMTKISNRKTKPPKPVKPKTNEVKKDLTNARVIQRKMAYVIGLPLSLADEDVLLRKEYFGQYGKVTKVSLSRTAGGAIQQFVNDTCSAYITYSKEEEALRCIQSVHGFILEGRYLRASFGTAKYCHAWLKNMPCNNPTCLYLHSIGPDEDSFGKDEVAAVHTRSRVQQIVGATINGAKRAGNVLPLADDMYNSSCPSTDKSTMRSGISDAAHGSINSTCDIPYSFPCKEKEGTVSVPHKMTTFVDIVGRSNCAAPEKDENSPDDRRFLDLCSKLSTVTVSGDMHTGESYSMPTMFEISSSDCSDNGLFKNFPDEPLRNDSLSLNNQGSKDMCGSSHGSFSLHPSYPANISENSDSPSLSSKRMHTGNDFTVDRNSVHNHEDEAALPVRSVNSILNDSCQDLKFQNSAKSDRIYRSSRSFSNEEIVEHLRRIDDDKLTNDVENSALEAVESSIISNIMSMDFDSCEDSLTMPNCLSELLEESYGYGGSSWSSMNSDQSGYSFVKQDGYPTQTAGCKSPHPVNRAQCLAPPGFSVPSRDPPPGFSSTDHVHSLPRPSSGNSSTLSTRLNAGSDDINLFDPAILSFAKGKQQTNGFSNPGFAAWPSPRLSPFEDESRLWLMMQQQQQQQQQQSMSHQDLKFSQMLNPHQQTPSGHLRLDDIYGGFRDQRQSFFNGHIPDVNGYPHGMGMGMGMDEVQRHTGEAGASNERYLGRYGDVMLNSGDVYARVLGL